MSNELNKGKSPKKSIFWVILKWHLVFFVAAIVCAGLLKLEYTSAIPAVLLALLAYYVYDYLMLVKGHKQVRGENNLK